MPIIFNHLKFKKAIKIYFNAIIDLGGVKQKAGAFLFTKEKALKDSVEVFGYE